MKIEKSDFIKLCELMTDNFKRNLDLSRLGVDMEPENKVTSLLVQVILEDREAEDWFWEYIIGSWDGNWLDKDNQPHKVGSYEELYDFIYENSRST